MIVLIIAYSYCHFSDILMVSIAIATMSIYSFIAQTRILKNSVFLQLLSKLKLIK
jgi:hypothetical protein